VSVTRVQGRGHYIDIYHPDQLIAASKLEIYCSNDACNAIASCIIEVAKADCDHEGILAISDVDKLYWVHTRKPISLDELNIIEKKDED
jgi:nitrogen regulatory protein PII